MLLLSDFVNNVVMLSNFEYEAVPSVPAKFGAASGVVQCDLLVLVGPEHGTRGRVYVANAQPVKAIRKHLLDGDDRPLIRWVRRPEADGWTPPILLREVDPVLSEALDAAVTVEEAL